MASKRYVTYVMPVQHINGKMARQAQKVKNADNSNPSDQSFYYGYKVNGRGSSRFGLREIPRNLLIRPYTTEENANKDLFRRAIASAVTVMRDQPMKSKAEKSYLREGQKRYIRLYNYIIARCHDADGGIPSEWA